MVRTLNDAKTALKTKKDDLPNRKGAKKTPTDGKVPKKASTSLPKPKKPILDDNGTIMPHRKQHRFRPGKLAEIEIRRYQKSTSPEFLVPKAAVYRLLKEIMGKIGDYRLSREGAYALRIIVEQEAVNLFGSANRMANHANRVTIMPADFDAVTDVRQFFPDASMRDKRHSTRYLEARDARLKRAILSSRHKPLTLKNRVTEVSTTDEDANSARGATNPTGYD